MTSTSTSFLNQPKSTVPNKKDMKALEAGIKRIAYCQNCDANINSAHTKGVYIGIPVQKMLEGKSETILTPLCIRCGYQYLITLSKPHA